MILKRFIVDFREFNGGQDMSDITAKQYLEYAVDHAGQTVLEAAYSSLHWVKRQCFLRVIFPCFINLNKKYRFDLPDCSRCNFVFVIVEQEIYSEDSKLIAKLKKHLSSHTELQIEVGASQLREILPRFKWARKEALSLRKIISMDFGEKGDKLYVDEILDMRVVEFCWESNRTSLITPAESKFPSPAKQLMRKCSKKVYQLYFKQLFLPHQQKESSLLPRGWVNSGATPFYFGLSQLRNDYKSEELPVFACEAEQLLSLIPHSISIPLFSFALFSVLKYFYPGYPNRISVQNSYQYVKRNLGKILFLSLEGKNKSYVQEAAELYCGTFLRHSLPGTPAREEESRYIHDGVFIVSENFKNRVKITEKNLDSYIVRNACVLFVNLPLPVNASPVKIAAKVDESAANSINLKAYRDRVDALLWYFIRFFEQYPGKTMGARFEEHPEEYPKALSKAQFNEQCVIWKSAFLKWYKNTIATSRNRARDHLKGFSTDKLRTEKCVYLLSSYLIFTEFIKCFDMEKNSERIDKLCQAGILEFQRLCRGYDWLERMMEAFAAYVSELLEDKAVVPIRGPQTAKTFGWFDAQKQLLLLPYSSYFESFLRFYQQRYGEKLCCTKSEFQTDFLAQYGFIQLKPNGKQSRYLRADCRIEVGPAGEKEAHKENVIKISVESFHTSAPLSQEAAAEIKKLNDQTFRRRAPNRQQQRTN